MSIINNILKKLVLNENGKISITKIGGWVISISAMLAAQGIVPLQTAETIAAIGGLLGITGARDAIGKK